MLIDTHAHLDYDDFAEDFDAILENARLAGVSRIISIGTSVESSRKAVALAEAHSMVYAVVGVHPNSVPEDDTDVIPDLRELAKHPKVVAIGETGLDYHYLPGDEARQDLSPISALGAGSPFEVSAEILDDAYKARQARYFVDQLELACELGLNAVVHQRDSWQDTLELLEPYHARLRAVFHCFGGPIEDARMLIAHGHLVSFTGIVTFKNGAAVLDVAKELGEGEFMVETDCPYLAPAPHRGKRCEPAHTRLVADQIAAAKEISVEELARQTTATAEKFFRFSRP